MIEEIEDRSVEVFLEKHKEFEIDFDTFFGLFVNSFDLHNHTFENLVLYFSLEKHMAKGRVHFYPGIVFFNDRRRYKWFISCIVDSIDKLFDFSCLSSKVKKKMSFYSAFEFKETELIKSKFKETVYNLEAVFNEQTYFEKYRDLKRSDIKKKIYNKINYPFSYLARPELQFRVEDITEDLLPEIEDLHKRWCEHKLADPKTFQMMFSSNRYYRCIEESFNSPLLKESKWYLKAFYLGQILVAVRQCLLKGDTSYDIGYFSRFWDCPSNLINYINTYCLLSLQQLGVKWHSCGNEMDKNLKRFKEHYPFEERFGWKYNFK